MGRELQSIDAVTRQIERLERATAEILSCRDVVQVKRLADMGEMLKLAAKRVKASVEVQDAAVEAAVNARHWEGQLIKEMEKNNGGRPGRNGKTGPIAGPVIPSLADLGITKNESSRAQAIAAIPKEKLDRAIAEKKKAGEELTIGAFVAMGRSLKSNTPEARKRWRERQKKVFEKLAALGSRAPARPRVAIRPDVDPDDAAWLETLLPHRNLEYIGKFRDDALAMRHCRPLLQQIKAEFDKRVGSRGPVGMTPLHRVLNRVWDIAQAESWFACDRCEGSGRVDGRKCRKCLGMGYIIPGFILTEKPLPGAPLEPADDEEAK
jgi:hypothetical protein